MSLCVKENIPLIFIFCSVYFTFRIHCFCTQLSQTVDSGVRLARSFDRLIREPLLDSMQHGRWTAQTVHDVNVDSENRSARAQSEDGRVESYGNRIEIDREPRVLTKALLAWISFKRRRKLTPCVLTRGEIFARKCLEIFIFINIEHIVWKKRRKLHVNNEEYHSR